MDVVDFVVLPLLISSEAAVLWADQDVLLEIIAGFGLGNRLDARFVNPFV